jgi:hypothetical protein
VYTFTCSARTSPDPSYIYTYIHLFVVYLTMLPVAKAIHRRLTGRLNEYRTGKDIEGSGRGQI